MRWCPLTAAAAIFLLSGCGDFDSIASSLDVKTEPTQWFWAELQGIEYDQIPQIQQSLESAKTAINKEYDIDKMSEIYLGLSRKHDEIARQLGNLNSTDVDEQATSFRDRLVKSHRNLAVACNDFAQAAKERDFEKVEAGKPVMFAAMTDYATVWNDRTAVMAGLKQKYSRDFNVVP